MGGSDHLEQKVIELLRKILKSSAVGSSAAFGSIYEWDSLKHIEVIMGIEREFGVKVGPANVVTLTSVDAILGFLRKQDRADVSR